MAKFTAEQRADFVVKTIPLLRELRRTKQTMSYSQFAEAIGIIRLGERWTQIHLMTVSNTPYLTRVLFAKAGEKKFPSSRVVNKATGKPGAGIHKQPRLAFEPIKQTAPAI